MAKILLIEDMKGVRESLEVILSMAGHTVEMAENGKVGIEKLDTSIELLITDILMPETDGTEVVLKSKERYPSLPIIAISAGGHGASAEQALLIAAGKADATLEKPFSKDELLSAINKLLNQ